MKRLLRIRRKAKHTFKRQEYFKHVKLQVKWRRPRGKQSKLRMDEKARGKKPSPGFSAPRKVRGLTPQGLQEVRVHNPAQLTKEMETKAIVIASTVGKKKRNDILKRAEELGLKMG